MNPHPHPLPQALRERDKIGSRFITHKFDAHPARRRPRRSRKVSCFGQVALLKKEDCREAKCEKEFIPATRRSRSPVRVAIRSKPVRPLRRSGSISVPPAIPFSLGSRSWSIPLVGWSAFGASTVSRLRSRAARTVGTGSVWMTEGEGGTTPAPFFFRPQIGVDRRRSAASVYGDMRSVIRE